MPLAYNIPPKFSTDLVNSLEWSRRQQVGFLDKRMEILRQIVGKHFGRNGCKERVPQNFIRLYCSVISRFLVSRSPSCLIEAGDARYRPLARQAKLWAKQYFSQLSLEKVLQKWAYEALIYPVALLKVCPPEENYGGRIHADDDMPGPEVYNVDPERSIWDMAATGWDSIDYIGQRCTVPVDEMFGDGWDEDRVQELVPDPQTLYNERGGEKSEALSLDDADWGKRLRPYQDFWELYLPKEDLLVSYPVIGNTIDTRPIRVQEFHGPKGRDCPAGPFFKHSYEETPGQLMANPPVHVIYDLHLANNRMFRKLLRQAERQKTTTLVQSQYKAEGEDVRKAGDGDMIPVSNPAAFNELRMGGPDQHTMNFNLHAKSEADYFGGNISVMGGLGAQSPTATQDQLLSNASSQQLNFLQNEMLASTRPVMKALLWHKWNSPGPLIYNEPSVAGDFAYPIEEEQRSSIAFEQLKISVHPYSMQPVTPQMRIAQYQRLFQQTILPVMPFLMQQGVTIDFGEFIRLLAELEDLPYVDQILSLKPLPEEIMQQLQAQGPQQMQGPRIRPEGTGQYTRTSVSGPEDKNQQLMEAMTAASNADAAS